MPRLSVEVRSEHGHQRHRRYRPDAFLGSGQRYFNKIDIGKELPLGSLARVAPRERSPYPRSAANNPALNREGSKRRALALAF